MRSLVLLGVAMAGLALFFDTVCCAAAPSNWRHEWPRTDFSRDAVPLSEIRSGGPAKDGIPAIDAPRFEAASELVEPPASTEPVMIVAIGGEARAYPLSVLVWHEIVNDVVADVPIAATFCPLCNSGLVFGREVAGEVTSFGTTGKLRNSNLVMYDRATESWWQQYEGRAIVGERAGYQLEKLPVQLESYKDFRERDPDGLVLVPSDPRSRQYGRNPYVGYDRGARPLLYEGHYDGPGSPLMRVVAVEGRDEAWSFAFLRKVLTVELGDLVIRWHGGQSSALDTARISQGRDVGTVTVQRRHSDGTLEDVVYDVPFAFAFRAFHPDAPVHHVE